MTYTDATRSAFKQFNKLMLLMWRLGLGPWINMNPETTGRIMVLITTGRRSGLKRRTPVNYAQANGDVYCMAGFGKASDWYRNLQANPEVEVWLPDGWWAGHAEEVTDPDEYLTMARQILINSGFAAETFEGINPHTISDEALREKLADRPLVRIQLDHTVSGPYGPGDLAWVWPVAGGATLVLLWVLRRGKRETPVDTQ
jgi:deazaflavin-dependent oxidoreductase (nitroreductase family)